MPPASQRPNILVFLTDDHGQWASSAYGNREIHSPVMQWLADTGARYDHAFSPNPVCSPARASFWTGMIPSRHGLHDFLSEPNEQPEHHGIAGQPSLGSFLHDLGYRTGLVGKWHAGDYWQPMPGFDTWFTSTRGTNARFGEQRFVDGNERVDCFGHQEHIYTDRAVRFLKEWAATEQPAEPDSRAPFFLFVGYTNTHTPHTAEPAPLVHHYRKATFSDIPRETYKGAQGHPRIATFDPDEPDRRPQLADYYASVENIDQQMLRLVAELENLGQLDNTLIVYTSDHGHMNGHHGLHTKTNATIPPNFLEETLHVPLLLRWPGAFPEGRVMTEPVDHHDTFATLLDAAGADVEAITRQQVSPGRSTLPLLRGEAQKWRDTQCCESGPHRVIRSATAKLIRRYPNPVGPTFGSEFYDLVNDPRETTNQIANPVYAEVIRELDVALETHFVAFEDPEKSGITAAGLAPRHNPLDSYRKSPGDDDHRQ